MKINLSGSALCASWLVRDCQDVVHFLILVYIYTLKPVKDIKLLEINKYETLEMILLHLCRGPF